jgi:hypothetical protein
MLLREQVIPILSMLPLWQLSSVQYDRMGGASECSAPLEDCIID